VGPNAALTTSIALRRSVANTAHSVREISTFAYKKQTNSRSLDLLVIPVFRRGPLDSGGFRSRHVLVDSAL
jgi:hypothetical protein